MITWVVAKGAMKQLYSNVCYYIFFFVTVFISLLHQSIKGISIYTLSDHGDLSSLIGSLSRTIQQYSPPSEWIMCELGIFPIFCYKTIF